LRDILSTGIHSCFQEGTYANWHHRAQQTVDCVFSGDINFGGRHNLFLHSVLLGENQSGSQREYGQEHPGGPRGVRPNGHGCRNFARNLSNDGTLHLLVTYNLTAKVQEFLTEKVPQDEYVITIMNTRGEYLAGAPADASSSPLAQAILGIEPPARHTLAALERLPPENGSSAPQLAISAASALINKDDVLVGVLLARWPIDDNSSLLDRIRQLLGVSAALYVNGQPISATDDAPLAADLYQRALRAGQQPVAVEDIRAGGQLAQYIPLFDSADAPVAVLGISLSADKYVETRQQAMSRLVGIMLACILGASLLAYLLARSITVPIVNLLNGVNRITSGDLAHEITVHSRDELGVLAEAFNSMAKELASLIGTLEQRVKDRTRELQDTLARMTAIIDNMADGLLVADLQGRIARINPALSALLSLRSQIVLDQPASEVLHADVVALMDKITSGAEEYATSEIALAHGRIGKAVATAIHPTALEAEASQPAARECIGAVILARDITKEKEIDQMKTDFISTVSHELRTPLTSVIGFAKIIKKRFENVLLPRFEADDDAKVRRAVQQVNDNLDIIIAEGDRLTTLINDVLDVAKMEAGKIDWKMEAMPAAEIIERAAIATSALFASKGLAQIKDAAEDLPPIVGDRDRLIQVVINLISNAVKFTDAGSVTCRAATRGRELLISVTDTGMGIAADDLPKVFEKFKQVGDTLTDKPKGTGLGLSICKQIVEHHGGRIWAESAPGAGSTFAFTLPILAPPSLTVTLDRQRFKQQAQERSTIVSVRADDHLPTVLVVDDDELSRSRLRQELEPRGYVVREASTGAEALNQLRCLRPDVMLADVLMPDLNGLDLVVEAKSDPRLMDVPILLTSDVPEALLAHHPGARQCLVKPFDTETLLQHLTPLFAAAPLTIALWTEAEASPAGLEAILRSKGCRVVPAAALRRPTTHCRRLIWRCWMSQPQRPPGLWPKSVKTSACATFSPLC
jgi:PAS domain S-box-containing protein